MNNEHRSNLSENEETKLDELPREKKLRAEIEDDLVIVLLQKGLIERNRKPLRLLKYAFAIAATLVVFFAGAFSGRMHALKSIAGVEGNVIVHAEREFMLLLYESPGKYQNPAPEDMLAVIAEYSDWANELASYDQLIGAEKLKTEGNLLITGSAGIEHHALEIGASGRTLAGYFAITAGSIDEALEISANCPHLKYGGEIELREIDHVNRN